MTHIIYTGSLESGYKFFGPFPNYEDAVKWGDNSSLDYYQIVPLLTPIE